MFVEKRHPLPKGVVFEILKIEYPMVWNLKFKHVLSPCGDLSISIWNFQLWLPNRSCYTTGATKLQLDPKTENTGGRLFETTEMIKSLGKKAKQGMNIEHDEGGGLNFLSKRVFVCSPGSQTRGRAKNSHRITNVHYANYEPIKQKISWSPPPLFFLTRMVFAPLPRPRHNVWQCNKDAREATTWQRCTMATMVTMVIWKKEPQRAHK